MFTANNELKVVTTMLMVGIFFTTQCLFRSHQVINASTIAKRLQELNTSDVSHTVEIHISNAYMWSDAGSSERTVAAFIALLIFGIVMFFGKRSVGDK